MLSRAGIAHVISGKSMASFRRRRSGKVNIAPQDLRRLADRAQKGAPHSLPVAKPGHLRDVIEAVALHFNSQPCGLDSKIFDRLGRGLACLCGKGSAELSGAQTGDVGQLLDGQRPIEMTFGIGQRRLDPIRFRLQFQQRRMLRLAAGAAVLNDHGFGDRSRNLVAEIALYQGKRQIDCGGHAG